MLSSRKPKEVWKVIPHILHPNPQQITMQPDQLNNFFASTAKRTIGINIHHVDDYASIINLIESLPANFDNGFQIRTVTLKDPLPVPVDSVLFNIYVADLQENLNVKCFQYADDTTIYDYAKISDLNNCRNIISQSDDEVFGLRRIPLPLTTSKPRL